MQEDRVQPDPDRAAAGVFLPALARALAALALAVFALF